MLLYIKDLTKCNRLGMGADCLPRYLYIAHWLHGQGRPMSSREVADTFNFCPKAISDDFSKMRKRREIIVFHEQEIRVKGVKTYLIHVLNIHPYRLDGRQCPHKKDMQLKSRNASLEWRDLLSNPWSELMLKRLK